MLDDRAYRSFRAARYCCMYTGLALSQLSNSWPDRAGIDAGSATACPRRGGPSFLEALSCRLARLLFASRCSVAMADQAEAEAAARSRIISAHEHLLDLAHYERVLGAALPKPPSKAATLIRSARTTLSVALRCLNNCTGLTRTFNHTGEWLEQRHNALTSAADTGTALPFDILLLGLVSCSAHHLP